MKDPKKFIIAPDASIREALQIIDEGAERIALITDSANRLIGAISDGDIRRGLLKGMNLDDSIEPIYNRQPFLGRLDESTELIKKRALNNKIFQIPIVDQNGVLIGVEIFNELLENQTRSNTLVIMAGGLGTRLGELTKDTPKPMLPVGNKPILETIIDNYVKCNFKNIIISVNYLSHVIEDYFGDGDRFGVKIRYIHEDKRLGTAGALDLMRDYLIDPFFVMNGDILTNINFEHLYDFHLSRNALGTMCVREYDFQVPYGTVHIENDKILSIDEKPVHSFYVSAGIYMFSPLVLNHVPSDQFFDMPSLFESIIKKNEIAASFPMREYWLDIGHLKDYERANNEYREFF